MIIKFLIGLCINIAAQFLTRLILKSTPNYRKDDKKIPIYHIVIAVTVSMMLFFFGLSMNLVKGILFVLTLLYASICDIQTHRVKDFVSVLLLVISFVGVGVTDIPKMLLSGLVIGLFMLICAMISKNKLGGADVKIATACAFLLGFSRSLGGLIIGLFSAVIINLILNRKTKTKAFPLIPYLSVGFAVMYFF